MDVLFVFALVLAASLVLQLLFLVVLDSVSDGVVGAEVVVEFLASIAVAVRILRTGLSSALFGLQLLHIETLFHFHGLFLYFHEGRVVLQGLQIE